MLSVRIVVFQDGEGYVPVFVGELIFQDDFMEKAGYVGGGIAEGAASEGSEHQGVVAVYQAYTKDSPDLVANGLDKMVGDHSVRPELRPVHAGYGYESQLAGLFHQPESIAFLFPEYSDRRCVDTSEVPVQGVLLG